LTKQKFQSALASLEDQTPDDLSDEDWETLGNILLAYIWKDDFATKLKEIEKESLLDKQNEIKSMITYLRRPLPPSLN
jgi:hypothetical protein